MVNLNRCQCVQSIVLPLQSHAEQLQKQESVLTKPRGDALTGWRDVPGLKLLHLMYDVTPSEFVTMVYSFVSCLQTVF